MIAVVDTGGANIASVGNALDRLDRRWQLTAEPQAIRDADAVILPGVGAAADSMQRLRAAGLVGVLRALKQPTLGICLGMQLLFERSEEGDVPCLGIIEGTVVRMSAAPGIRIPHMGWNRVEGPSGLLEGIEEPWFYFVHSFCAPAGPHVVATTRHGTIVPSIVERENFHGVQFHPERSAAAGAQLLQRFVALA